MPVTKGQVEQVIGPTRLQKVFFAGRHSALLGISTTDDNEQVKIAVIKKRGKTPVVVRMENFRVPEDQGEMTASMFIARGRDSHVMDAQAVLALLSEDLRSQCEIESVLAIMGSERDLVRAPVYAVTTIIKALTG